MDEIEAPRFEGIMKEHDVMGIHNPKVERVSEAILGNVPRERPQMQMQQQQYPQQRQQMDPFQQQMMQQHNNPFNLPQYGNVHLPDVPLMGAGGMADQMLNDREVPEEIRAKFWNIFHKDNTLTFLDPERKQSKLLNFDIMKIDMLNSIPYYDYDFDKELEFGIMRNVFETKLDRSLGSKDPHIKNERIMLQSQFSENRQISENGDQNIIKEGFFKRLLGRR